MEFDLADQLDLEWHNIFQKHLKNFSCQNETQTLSFEEILKKIFCLDSNDECEIKNEDKELCEKCLIDALTLLSNRPTIPRQTQIQFLLNIAKYTSRDESCFINLNASQIINTLIYLIQPSADIKTKLLFMEFIQSFLEHPSGIKWLMDTRFWTNIFRLTVNYEDIDNRVSKIGYDILRVLLEKTNAMNKQLSEEIITFIAGRIINTAQQLELLATDPSYKLDGLKPILSCFVNILEGLLENYSATVLHDIMDHKIGLACDAISEKSNDMDLCLNCDRINIILSFFGLTEVFDGIKSIKEDPLVLCGFFKIIDREVSKDLLTMVFKLYYYALKYYKFVSDKLPTYYFNEEPISPETQLIALQLEPILLEWARLDGATDIFEVDDNVDVSPISHPMKLFKKLCLKTLNIGFKMKDKLPPFSFDMYCKAVEMIMQSKHLYSKKSLGEVLDTLVYSLEAPLKYIQSKKHEEVVIKDAQQLYILTLLDATLLFIDSFNICWCESIKGLDLLYIVIEGSSAYPWIEPIMLDSLFLLEKIISKRLSPSMALLIDTADGLRNIGPLLYKTCFTNEWKIRNAVLEVVYTIAFKANDCFSTFKKILFDASLPSLISTMALNDENLSVKATALKCLQQMIVWEDIDEILSKNTLIVKVLDMIKNNKDQLFRKEAIKFITAIYQHEKFIDKDVLTNIYKCLEQLALADDNDAYVQKELVEFWRGVIRAYLLKQGWLDVTFPTVTFSKRIISLTNEEVHKRYYKAFSGLSRIGALNVFEKFWQFNKNHEEAKESLLQSLRRFHYNFITHQVTPEAMLFMEETFGSSTQLDSPAAQESEDILQQIINDTLSRMMPNDIQFVNNEDLFLLLDTNYQNVPSTTAEPTVEVTRHMTPSEFVKLVYQKFDELNPERESDYIDGECRSRNVYVIDY